MKSKQLNCQLEQDLAVALGEAGIVWLDENENGKGLDFYLPEHEVYIEVKGGTTPRVLDQMKRDHNVIVVQGRKSVDFLVRLLMK